MPGREPFTHRATAWIGDGQMPNARIRFKQLPSLAAADQENSRLGKPALGRIEDDAGDGDVGPQRDAREHEHTVDRAARELPRPADSAVASQELFRVQLRL